MRLKPHNGVPGEIREIGGIEMEEEWGYHIRGVDGKHLGFFGADHYENITFETWWVIDSSSHYDPASQ